MRALWPTANARKKRRLKSHKEESTIAKCCLRVKGEEVISGEEKEAVRDGQTHRERGEGAVEHVETRSCLSDGQDKKVLGKYVLVCVDA